MNTYFNESKTNIILFKHSITCYVLIYYVLVQKIHILQNSGIGSALIQDDFGLEVRGHSNFDFFLKMWVGG